MNDSFRELDTGPGNVILTNAAVWSPDSQWIVYDRRSDPVGAIFDGTRIERINVRTGEVELLYESQHGSYCGVATYHPTDEEIVFIHGPEYPTPDWSYNAWHRQGFIVATSEPGIAKPLDARDVMPPFTIGALRGGSHVHLWSPDGSLVSFTYEDHPLATVNRGLHPSAQSNQRTIGVTVVGQHVSVPTTHPRNRSGNFSVCVVKTWDQPLAESEQLSRACEEAWLGPCGPADDRGVRQSHALAFQGTVLRRDGGTHAEVYIVRLPNDLTRPDSEPLCGTVTTRPGVPSGVTQQRLTWTDGDPRPGLCGPRHWLRSSANGNLIGCLRADRRGISQLHTVDVRSGTIRQVSDHAYGVQSAFTWHPTQDRVAYLADDALTILDVTTGQAMTFAPPRDRQFTLRSEACVWSPDGRRVALVMGDPKIGGKNRIFCAEIA